jgi:hypothetical protein
VVCGTFGYMAYMLASSRVLRIGGESLNNFEELRQYSVERALKDQSTVVMRYTVQEIDSAYFNAGA